MADLQSCYFCGSPDDLGEYAVVPPRLGGGDRSVVLCPDCKTKLLRAIEPLIERAEAGAAAGDDAGGSANEPSAGEQADSDLGAGGITMSPHGAGPSSGSDDGEGDTATEAASTPAGGEDKPPQYRRAMRMLSNRPFPMDRGEVESMLATAYDLEREEIEAVLEHAESEGRLVAENGQLREP